MALREQVFKSKVLQKLYPPAPTPQKEPSPPHITEALAKRIHVRRKVPEDTTAAGGARSTAVPRGRIYTVLPPPADYEKHLENSVTLPQLESINSANNPAEENTLESNEKLGQDKESEEKKRKKRKRKAKPAPQQRATTTDDASGSSGSGDTPNQTVAAVDGGEQISRNKKRKLKKKRHKEKLRSMGVMPKAAALVFTYQKDGGQEGEKEENEERAAEVADFLRGTLKVYMSDTHLHVDRPPLLLNVVEDLLSRLASSSVANVALEQLYCLQKFVQQKETGKLERALQELPDVSGLSADESAAVVSLFQYWVTDILPMQEDRPKIIVNV